jgi:hypothetical protein
LHWLYWEIFPDGVDRQSHRCGIKTLAAGCQKTAWQVRAYCLMRNHFHPVPDTPKANLVAGMRWLLNGRNGPPGLARRWFGLSPQE